MSVVDDLLAFVNARLDEEEERVERWSDLISVTRSSRELRAKRKILDLCRETLTGAWTAESDDMALQVAQPLTSIYSDHPDYDNSWT